MAAILARVLMPLSMPKLRTLGLRARLKAAERAIDGPFDKRRSLQIDALVVRLERAQRGKTTRGLRRAA